MNSQTVCDSTGQGNFSPHMNHGSWFGFVRRLQKKHFFRGSSRSPLPFIMGSAGNPQGTRLLLQAALMRLDSLPDDFGGVCVAPLRDDIRSRLAHLETDSTSVSPVEIRLIAG